MKILTRKKQILFLLSMFFLSAFFCRLVKAQDQGPTSLDDLITLVSPFDPGNDNPLPPPIETPSGICAPSIELDRDSAGMPVCGRFLDHLDAERHFYHCQEGVAIMGAAIVQRDSNFVPVLSTEDFATRAKAENVGDPLEIYPDSGIVAFHTSHREAEIGYLACELTNFQYWTYLESLQAGPKLSCVDAGPMRDGANNFLWKPLGDPTARCRGRAAVLAEPALADFVSVQDGQTGIILYDESGEKIGDGFYKGNSNGNRPSYCTDKAGSEYGDGPIYVEFLVSGAPSFCKTVSNPSARED